MSLCRYLPTPSERMGILWSLLEIKEAIVLEFGPAGTTHYSIGVISNLGIEVSGNLYSTHLDEDDVIMGDTKRIEEALLEIDREYKPKYIFVLGSAVSSIIATDLKGICTSMEDTINAKMIAFEGGGFRGDYALGLKEALETLAVKIVKQCKEEKTNTFNIIGACSEEYRVRSNVEEIKNIMKECFDYNIGTAFTINTSITDIENAGTAGINLVIRNEGIKAANIIEEKTGTPYLYGCPYGYSGTLSWVENISKIINKNPSKEYIEKLRKSMINGKQFYMYKYMMNIPLKVSIIGNYDMIVGLKKFFTEDVGFDIENIICSHSLKNCSNKDESIKYIEEEKERIKILEGCNDSIILGDDVSLEIVNNTNIKVRISNPNIKGAEYCTHMPFIGYKGAEYLLEKVSEYVNKLM